MIVKVPHLPAPGETVLGGEFVVAQGGKGANQAVAAARAGGNVTFVSCVGNDLFGEKSLEVLANEKIDISSVKIVDGYASGVALINVADSGENSISVAPGANSLLLPEDIEKITDTIINADIILLQLEIPLESVKTAISIANRHKVPVILNPAPGQMLDTELLKSIDYLTPNENEAALIAELKDPEEDYTFLSNALQEKGSKAIVLTLGEQGAFFSDNGQLEHIPGHRVNAVDTTAAGDTFNGYLAVALAQGECLKNAVSLANKAASLSVTMLGAQPSIPHINSIITT